MKIIYFKKKYAAILAIAVSAIVFYPEVLLAKGAVIGYATISRTVTPVSYVHLNRLTHLMVYNL